PRDADPIAVLAPGQAADRFAAIAQVAGLVVGIERQRDRASRAARPLDRPQLASRPDAIDELAPMFLRPLPRFEIGIGSAHAFLLTRAVGPRDGGGLVGAVRFELTTLSTPC